MSALTETAPAKVNLTLHILGRRADGYHELESLVVFARAGDSLALVPGDQLGLTVSGPRASASGNITDNLVLKAARDLAARHTSLRVGQFVLDKQLPVAAGLGGGSADAAAALRLLARANDLQFDDPRIFEAARATGADVPVCLISRACVMRGVGDVLSDPVSLVPLCAVLVNPGVAVATKDVFQALAAEPFDGAANTPAAMPVFGRLSAPEVVEWLAAQRNDLEPPAVALQPVIGDVLGALRRQSGCRLARMSGSGATCFGLFDDDAAAQAAAAALTARHPGWWVRADRLS